MGTILKIAGFVLFPSIGGTAGGFITRKKIKTWFADLDKPAWRPPNWAFGPVWTTLYSGTNLGENGSFLPPHVWCSIFGFNQICPIV